MASLEPSVTATLFALGQQARLVAVSKCCHHLVDVGDRPRLPPTWSANAEEIAALSPDLIVASVPYRAESIEALLRARLDVLCLYPKRLQDAYAHIAWLGRLTDADDEARRVIAQMQSDFQAIRQRVAGLPHPRVYVEMWPEPPMGGPGWVADLVAIAGGEFVLALPGRQITDEEVFSADPEIIVVAWAGVVRPSPQQVIQRPGWERVAAVQTGRVVAVDEIWINAPGPNLARGARLLAAAIHPEVFPPDGA